MDTMLDPELVRSCRSRLRFSHKVSSALVQDGLSSLQEAKQLHDNLEEIYHPHVDFQKGTLLAQDLIRQLHLDKKRDLK
jgi:hypothetical protein